MSWWGKVIGGALGFAAGGPLGALLGAALGHTLDSSVRIALPPGETTLDDREQVQGAFFAATFTVMGRIAKADGQVTQDEIQFARQLMDQMNLDQEHREVAKRLFSEGKASDFPLDPVLDQFRALCGLRIDLLQMFLEIQIQAACADGTLDDAERRVLVHAADRLGVPRGAFNRLEAMIRAHINARRAGLDPRQAPADRLAQAYDALGIGKDATTQEITRAYRRLMSEHHPDKLVSKGLPEEMIRLANEKTQDIKRAYDTLRAAKGF